MNPTNKALEIDLGGKRIDLYFDFAATKAFERETGNHFMNWAFAAAARAQMLSLEIEMIGSKTKDELTHIDTFEFMRCMGSVMSLSDFASIVWATHHTLTHPIRWPMTIDEVFRECDMQTYATYSLAILQAAMNSLKRRDLSGKPAEEKPDVPTNPSALKTPSSGGRISGESPDDVLASLTKKSTS